ncbi:MAG TPA: hypothetical protein VLE97_02715, partial [Gaiellaceae bacterium]|nr:hypothetical protein [Gaiellaceae bacterium]
MLRRREERAARAAAPVPKPKPAKTAKTKTPTKPRPTELQRIEAEIAAQEVVVGELEAKLATDWSDVETLAAHKHGRDTLSALLARWEELFEAHTERA